AWPLLDQAVVPVLHRLDVDAAPTAIVESLRDRVDDWVLRADIDIEAALDMLQCTPQKNVFTVLGIGDELTFDHGRGIQGATAATGPVLSQNADNSRGGKQPALAHGRCASILTHLFLSHLSPHAHSRHPKRRQWYTPVATVAQESAQAVPGPEWQCNIVSTDRRACARSARRQCADRGVQRRASLPRCRTVARLGDRGRLDPAGTDAAQYRARDRSGGLAGRNERGQRRAAGAAGRPSHWRHAELCPSSRQSTSPRRAGLAGHI